MSFTDSFLDFEAIKNWFENTAKAEMTDGGKIEMGVCEPDSCLETVVQEHIVGGSEPIVIESKSIAVVEERESEKLENVSCSIEEDMGKVSLVGESANLVATGEKGMSKSDTADGNGERKQTASLADESESSESETASTSSSSASSSSSSSSDDDEDSNNDVEEEKKDKSKVVKAGGKVNEAGEVEEGEIRDADLQDIPDDDSDDDEDDDDQDDEDEDVEAMVGWSDVEEDAEDSGLNPIRSKNEAKDLPPVPSVEASLLPHHQMTPVGVVLSVLGCQVIVEGSEKHSPLSDGSILWITESRSPLGFVDEIFGPVKLPYYVVRYNSEDEVPAGISPGSLVSFVPEFASHVLSNKDIYKKGYDASGANDEELTDEDEFSDDEKEAEHKRMLKAAKRGANEPKPRRTQNKKNNVPNRGEPWRNGNPSAQPMPKDAGPIPPNQNHHGFSPFPATVDHGNFRSPFSDGQGLVEATGPPFPVMEQASCFSVPSNGGWPNGMPYYHPQGAFFPNGFPMPWAAQNVEHYIYPMPYNQPVNPNQNINSGHPNNFAGTPYPQGHVGQNGFNPNAVGFGLQGQPSQNPGLNVGEQGFTPNGAFMGQSFNGPPSGEFNSGPSGRGRGSYRGRGGRSGRGRGRKQWN